MAGSILGKDQVAKINRSYVELRAHIQTLFDNGGKPVDAVDLMRIHTLTEFLDTTELSRIFMELPFLSPAEKRALVRVAIFSVVGQHTIEMAEVPKAPAASSASKPAEALKTFTPPQFRLNVATTEAHLQEEKPVEPEAAAPKTPTALKVVDGIRKEANAANEKAQAERTAAVAEIRKPLSQKLVNRRPKGSRRA